MTLLSMLCAVLALIVLTLLDVTGGWTGIGILQLEVLSTSGWLTGLLGLILSLLMLCVLAVVCSTLLLPFMVLMGLAALLYAGVTLLWPILLAAVVAVLLLRWHANSRSITE